MHDSTRRRRSLELLAKADETLARAAVAAAERSTSGEPDAATAWAASMPPKPKPEQPPQESRMSGAELRVMALRADYERTRREDLAYRNGLEKALGKVIAEQRKEVEKLRDEIAALRKQLHDLRADAAREVTELPALRLIGGQRG